MKLIPGKSTAVFVLIRWHALGGFGGKRWEKNNMTAGVVKVLRMASVLA